jgi:hypothetical protein
LTMPTYVMYNKNTGYEQVEFMSISEMEHWLENNLDWDVRPSAPMIHSGAGLSKPDDTFRDVLKQIKKNNSRGISRSTIETF